jgi:hypothetical protein
VRERPPGLYWILPEGSDRPTVAFFEGSRPNPGWREGMIGDPVVAGQWYFIGRDTPVEESAIARVGLPATPPDFTW